MKKIATVLAMAVVFCLINTNTSKAQDADTSTFVPHGSFSGYVFGDYYYKTHQDSMGRGAGNVQYRGLNPSATNGTNPNGQMDAFQIRRAYLNYDYDFARNLSAHATLADEAGPNISGFPGTNLDAGGSNTVYVKYFYLRWDNIFKGSNLLIGQQATPSFATPYGTEPLWAYRSIERTIMDLHNNDASSDMGVSLMGKLWQQDGVENPALIGYQLQVGNGNSAKPENDRFKKYRMNLYTSFMQQKITIGVYADYNNIQNSPYHMNTTTMKGYIHFKSEWFRIGAEFFQQTTKNADIYKTSFTSSAVTDTADCQQTGFSVFASGRIIKGKLNIFARYDMYNPDSKFSSGNKYSATATASSISSSTAGATSLAFYNQTFYTFGLDWTPNSRFHIMPNVWYNQYQTMSGLTDYSTITATNTTGSTYSGLKANSNDMVYRLSFYFIFNASKKVANNGMEY